MFYDGQELSKYQAYARHLAYSISVSTGQQVTILPWTHGGAGAGYEKAVWDEWSDNGAGYRYVIGSKMGRADALIQMLKTIFSERTPNGWGRFNWNDLVQPTDPIFQRQRLYRRSFDEQRIYYAL